MELLLRAARRGGLDGFRWSALQQILRGRAAESLELPTRNEVAGTMSDANAAFGAPGFPELSQRDC